MSVFTAIVFLVIITSSIDCAPNEYLLKFLPQLTSLRKHIDNVSWDVGILSKRESTQEQMRDEDLQQIESAINEGQNKEALTSIDERIEKEEPKIDWMDTKFVVSKRLSYLYYLRAKSLKNLNRKLEALINIKRSVVLWGKPWLEPLELERDLLKWFDETLQEDPQGLYVIEKGDDDETIYSKIMDMFEPLNNAKWGPGMGSAWVICLILEELHVPYFKELAKYSGSLYERINQKIWVSSKDQKKVALKKYKNMKQIHSLLDSKHWQKALDLCNQLINDPDKILIESIINRFKTTSKPEREVDEAKSYVYYLKGFALFFLNRNVEALLSFKRSSLLRKQVGALPIVQCISKEYSILFTLVNHYKIRPQTLFVTEENDPLESSYKKIMLLFEPMTPENWSEELNHVSLIRDFLEAAYTKVSKQGL